jgi:sulfur carrier protein ThiS
VNVIVNGEPTELERGATVEAVLASLELPDRGGGGGSDDKGV